MCAVASGAAAPPRQPQVPDRGEQTSEGVPCLWPAHRMGGAGFQRHRAEGRRDGRCAQRRHKQLAAIHHCSGARLARAAMQGPCLPASSQLRSADHETGRVSISQADQGALGRQSNMGFP